MPFVKQERRQPLLDGTLAPAEVGDLCFLEYKPLMDAWRKEPRWTTIHNEAKRIFGINDDQAAKLLAFFEFYIRHGHAYENKKIAENGDL